MEAMLTDFNHVKAILQTPEIDTNLLFVFSEIFAKNILTEKFDLLLH